MVTASLYARSGDYWLHTFQEGGFNDGFFPNCQFLVSRLAVPGVSHNWPTHWAFRRRSLLLLREAKSMEGFLFGFIWTSIGFVAGVIVHWWTTRARRRELDLYRRQEQAQKALEYHRSRRHRRRRWRIF
jgi:hypothetical protein